MPAPEEEEVVSRPCGQHLRRMCRRLAGQDGLQVGGGEVAHLIINPHIVVEILAIGGHPHDTRSTVVAVLGNIVLHDEEDMVVVIALLFQQLVHR